ncbi:MAG TPA: GNAT family N-acetyltransferase [Candidatus Polarisedimenticolaceae bacterium]|nr:GNAT family N-acetyltransferase [Candidatus Polarisedimenticolaceae bacterium]
MSADWQERWSSKIRTAEEAIRAIRPGRRILIGSGAAEPCQLVHALVESGDHLADNDVVHLLTLGPAPYVRPGMERRFRHTAFFIGPNVREAVQQGRADFMPVFLSEIPQLLRSRRVPIDVAMIQVSPPDAHGYVSLGVSVDIVRAAVDSAELILAEVNPHMPRTLGNSFLHVDRIAGLVPVDQPLIELPVESLDEVSLEIGRHVASLIPDGATLQVGIGKIPNAVLAALRDRHDLGVHTEMMSDGVMELVDAGVINGRRKTLAPEKIVTSFIMGSRRLYAWAHDNPGIEMRSSDFTNDPQTIARNDRMAAINSALAVDLTGQVAADTLGGRFFSGIGGQVDFIRGASRSREGRAIIALPSTASQGKISRIQAALEQGAGVVTSRGDVHYVVTEYGIADLWGRNIRQRALALIEIAHPDFRGELLDAAKARHYVFSDQVAPRAVYPWAEARRESLRGGEPVIVRPVRLSDEEPLRDLFYRLSDESTYRRFMAYRKRHPHEEMQRLVDLDYEQSMALVVCTQEDGVESILAMSRYDVDPATRLADVAFVVRDAWQGRGIGTLLLRRMSEIARDRGLPGFTADVLSTNHPMLSVFQKSGLQLQVEQARGVAHLVAHLPVVEGNQPASTREPGTTASSPLSA